MTAHEAVQLIEASALFDANWYEKNYPDVKTTGISSASHFHKYGWRMMRDPSSQFSTASYLATHQDVKKESINPLLHYLQFGKKEGRGIVASHQSEKFKNLKIKNSESEPEKTVNQLAETQELLEKYYRRCQELESQMLDQKIKSESL